ncbi:SLIT-ROBO Rho GTPase-activating protein 3-like isoform X2 [Amphiura filiformis]|uniref:SLIT-ROBO Rho GTPase-activating protein 3-like isoform X2 n=1 Tax=Amphiura filiformis TaxID=82378 RepID=UPI003B21CC86
MNSRRHSRLFKLNAGIVLQKAEDIRNCLNDQLKTLDSRQESQQKLLEDFQELFKQLAEAESEYSKKLDKIYDSFHRRQSTHRVQRDYAGDGGVPSPVRCWNLLLENTRSQSKQHSSLGQMHQNNFANNLVHIREGLENVHRRSREMTVGVHDDLIRQLNELYSAIKSYHNSHRDCAEAGRKKKETEDEVRRIQNKNRKVDKRLEKQLDKNTDKFYEAELKAAKARNDYITTIGAVNSSLQKYFKEDVTNVIDCLDLGYIRLLKRNLMAKQSAEQQMHKMKSEELQRLELAIRNMHGSSDKELFLDANKNAFTLPELFDFHPHPGDQTHEMTAPYSFMSDMEQTYHRLNTKIDDLQLKVDENHKSMREVNRGWEDDKSNSLEEEVVTHFQSLRERLVSSPSVASGLNRTPSARRSGKHLQQETEFYYLSKYKEYLEKSNQLTRTKSKRDLLKTALGFDKITDEGSQEQHEYSIETDKAGVQHRRHIPDNKKTLSRRPHSVVNAKLFGGDLITYINASRRDIPLVVERCVEYITLYGLSHQGIFRTPGSQQDVDEYMRAFEKGRDVLYELGPKGDINLIASLLKKYFRDLPEPLFPLAMFDQFLDSTKIQQGQDRIPCLAQLVENLQKPVMVVMRYLFQFLKVLSQRSDETYMDSRNLATCLGPTLMWGPNAADALQYASNVNEVVETMILFQEDIFPKAEGNETEYSFISITEGKDGLDDIDEEKTDISAVANADYEGQSADQLSFKKGDEITLIKQIEGSLWEARMGEQKGIVPDSFMEYEEKEEQAKTPDETLEPPQLSPLERNSSTMRLVNDIDSTMQSALSSLDELSKLSSSTHHQPPPDLLRDTHPPLSRSRPASVPSRPASVGSPSTRSSKGPPPLIKPKPKRPIRPAPNSSFKPNPGFSIKTKTL